ncbi:unnamed protein product [Closterium sp. NIES-53]
MKNCWSSTCSSRTSSTMGPAGALDSVLLGAGWKKSQVEEALYFKASDNGVTCWVLVYVDDLLAANSIPAMLKELKQLLEAAFELHDISPVVKYLGLEIAQEREEEEYWQKVGSLHFAATTTRPDIAFACSKLWSGLTVRSDQHWHEVDRCLAYLADTRDTALEFGGGPESLELIFYVDANDAGNKQNRTSTDGYVFVFGGVAVFWSSQRIKCATLSSTESKYDAATDAGKEGRQLRFLLAEFKLLDTGKPTVFRVDNKSAITVAEGLGLTGNLKHMEQRYAWLQHMVRRGKFGLKYIPTTEQPADFLTKVDRVTCSASSAEARERRRGCDGEGDFRLVSRSRCGSSGKDNSGRMHNGASRANRLRALANVHTGVFYGATLDSRSAAALAHRRPAVLAGRLSAVLPWLLYAVRD